MHVIGMLIYRYEHLFAHAFMCVCVCLLADLMALIHEAEYEMKGHHQETTGTRRK